MTALPYLNSPALVALAILFAYLVALACVVVFFSAARHRDDVFRYDTPYDERREGTR